MKRRNDPSRRPRDTRNLKLRGKSKMSTPLMPSVLHMFGALGLFLVQLCEALKHRPLLCLREAPVLNKEIPPVSRQIDTIF